EENQAREEQKHLGVIEAAKSKQIEASNRLEQKRKLFAFKIRNFGDEDAIKKTLERLEQQLREDEKTHKDLGVQIGKTETTIQSLAKAKEVTQVPAESVADLIKNDPAAALLFTDQQKALKDLNEAMKVTRDENQLQRYRNRKFEADQAIEDYKLQNQP